MTDPQGPTVRFRAAVMTLAVFVVFFAGSSASAQETEQATEEPTTTSEEGESEVDEAVLAELREGAAVYTAICSSCHQPGGAGISGQFPPLINNPNVDDPAYVAEVINSGRQGELVVDGVTYDSVMPAFSTLSDAETQAVIAYIQNGFEAPPDENAVAIPTGPVAGTELPALTNMGH
ncbi:MAG: c-type cytochrome, partial [Acidimicrobiia bacterium]